MVRAAVPSLDKVDPATAWQAWEPDDKQPWNLQWAGHLYRRAGFGANLTVLREAVKNGHAAAVESVFASRTNYDAHLVLLDRTGANLSRAFDLRLWWVWAMLRTPFPLREKMTLFWHNHFVSSIAKV